jgi:hypothetical protein
VADTDPFDPPGGDATLEAILAAAWDLLERGARRASEDWHWPVLASVDAREPERAAADARVVVLRRAERGPRELEIHGDARSHKLAQLEAAPRACLVFHARTSATRSRAAPGTRSPRRLAAPTSRRARPASRPTRPMRTCPRRSATGCPTRRNPGRDSRASPRS